MSMSTRARTKDNISGQGHAVLHGEHVNPSRIQTYTSRSLTGQLVRLPGNCGPVVSPEARKSLLTMSQSRIQDGRVEVESSSLTS